MSPSLGLTIPDVPLELVGAKFQAQILHEVDGLIFQPEMDVSPIALDVSDFSLLFS